MRSQMGEACGLPRAILSARCHRSCGDASHSAPSSSIYRRPEERAAIWRIYQQKYGVSGELPDDDGWTGAEIKECCRKAYRLKQSLRESAEYIVPVSRSAAEQVKTLRQQASGKFISASYPGVYQFQESAAAPERDVRFGAWRVKVKRAQSGNSRGLQDRGNLGMNTDFDRRQLAREAKAIVALAFRNGPIEDIHAGRPCPTCTGQAGYSRISDAEMKLIMKNAVDHVYVFAFAQDPTTRGIRIPNSVRGRVHGEMG